MKRNRPQRHASVGARPTPFFLRRVALALAVALAVLSAPKPASARALTWTLTTTAGFGYEVHPSHHEQATNIMAALGLGILWDRIRFELGVLGAYGALWAHGPRHAELELRPMVRINPPLLPIYGRVIVAGLLPYADRANVAYGGAVGINIPLGRLGIMGEVGTLPRYVQRRMHWILEARAGVSVRL